MMIDNANQSCRCLLGFFGAMFLMAGCNNLEFHTAATGTEIEARQVVSLVYAQAPDSDIDKLLYSGGDLTRAIKRVRDRFPQLKPWLDQGVIGNAVSGFVALRDPSKGEQLHKLLRDENWDRAFLHDRASAAVGHEYDGGWLAYESTTYGKEWIAQGAPGWWWQDEKRQWKQGR